MKELSQPAHPTDGDLLRTVEPGPFGDLSARVRSHLESCERCNRRITGLRSREDRALELLRLLDPDPSEFARVPPTLDEALARGSRPKRSSRQRLGRIAIVLLLGMALVPAYAAASGRLDELLARIAALANVGLVREEATTPPAEYTFTARTQTFDVRFASWEASASMEVVGSDASSAKLRIHGGVPGLNVLRTGIAVDNRKGDGRRYHLELPGSVDRVRIMVADTLRWTVHLKEGAAPAKGFHFELDR